MKPSHPEQASHEPRLCTITTDDRKAQMPPTRMAYYGPMLEGRTVIFLSCMAAAKDRLAGPIRDQLDAIGYHAVIVMDEPLLRGSFDAESKVNAYIHASDAFVALCTADPRVPGGTAQNIIDEIGRARSHPGLREVVCVLKEASVSLPSNINPVWEALERDNPEPAFRVIHRQLNAWGVVPVMPRAVPSATTALPDGFLDSLFEGIQIGDHDRAESRIRQLFGVTTKSDQSRVAHGIFDYAMAARPDGKDIHVATSFLEACMRIDPTLVKTSWIEQLAESSVVQHRMGAAMILWGLAETIPGIVPLDLISKLAKPSSEDWYVFAPALGAAKQLSLTRKSALRLILDLTRSLSADDRDAAVRALADIAKVDPAVIPIEPVERLTHDSDSGIAASAGELLSRIRMISDDDRCSRYGRFGL